MFFKKNWLKEKYIKSNYNEEKAMLEDMNEDEIRDEFERMHEMDFINNALADINDVMSGRIKDIEHLQAIDSYYEKGYGLYEAIRSMIDFSQTELYDLINSKSIEELNNLFAKLDEFRDYLEGFCGECMDEDS